ncbi:type VII secretion protein EssC [Streptococcus acidominimus]|uniref:Type VII secretion protein EssC n=1 Tax=Streptococcus acidominimus TaxID=1326 RepID=A0A4Y9FS05_STRAI|nr:type VII secretion protein EssC [Streptococcus acidominimus]MBF0818413.1 type VII secretion protein EssC [Streptococcus acidominimus]MBF0838602.1 type VII secretion protein EssC [Streptococcus acidominimus]MBF0846371.1 type VII secretion protein EssC [Streptococcus danieliae]TFU31320.1 type VII secretion protein EssC [Streptococcus acidominimus]
MIYLIYQENAYPLYPAKTYLLGSEPLSDIRLPLENSLSLKVEKEAVSLSEQNYRLGIHQVSLADAVTITLMILPEPQYFLLPKNSLYLSGAEDATIRLKGYSGEIVYTFHEHTNSKVDFFSSDTYFLNGHKQSGKGVVRENDILVFETGIVLSLQKQVLSLSTLFELETSLLTFLETATEDRAKEFHRSPRIILREPEGQITIASAPTDEEMTKQSLLKLLITPLAMIVFTGLTYLFSRSGGMVFMMMGMSVITIGTSIHTYFTDKKNHKEKQAQKLDDYMSYLDTKYKELSAYQKEQIEALFYHYPDTQTILGMAETTDRRIYEKTPYHFDFLTYRLGLGEVPASFQIDYSSSELTKYNVKAGQKVEELLSYYKMISPVPIQNAITAPIGYIGNRRVVIEQVQQLMMQIATFQSYHDVQFIPIFREEELPLWDWSRWLPHTKIQAFNSRGFVYSQRTRDQLLTSLYQIIKERKLDSDQDKNAEKQYAPRYILLITDLSLLLDHNIMEYINEDLSHLGIHYIFVEEVIESLPEHIQTVVDYRGDKKATLLLQNGSYVNEAFLPMPMIDVQAKEDFARNMAGINHVQTLRNSIPNSITFLEMYGVSRVEELDLLTRWSENETYQTMAVPLGVRGRDDILYLNLHEKAHGPHGLIAGTTGSGKSELIQSYILSLAVHYHPYEVAFLLIDYKGGGMANLFAGLPHLVGTITNLDGNQANRALVSIKAELKKRQRIFLENDVNHINQYTKLFKEGKVKEPLPQLLIISDEFAELKANQPDFMDELVSTARIGRSLGVKLILATQKPSGVVNDQIWSNSKFKIALKVQDIADSREVIKTPDAAEITQTGRAYLQVGNNEIYELFQSAWSGADYNPDGKNQVQRETTIYEITASGQYSPINKDLSGLANQKEVKAVPTELDAIVEKAHEVFENLQLPKVASPWLPPLEEKVYAKQLQSVDFKDYWNQKSDPLEILMGYQDIPERQEQSPLYFNMEQAGHILLVSSPGFGKSTFLQSLAVDAMRKHTPADLHFYLYDFGTSGLIPLSDFPHVADYFTLDETEKILKSMRRLHEMVKDRKKALSKLKATNLRQYNQLSDSSFPTIFIMIDGFDSVTDAPFIDSFYDVLNIIARDGASLGMYLVTTMSRLNAMRLQLQSNFKTKISLYLFDTSDLSGIVGRSNIELDEIKGRAITKLDEITQFQIALPYMSEQYADYIAEVAQEVSAMNAAYTGELPNPVPMLPERVTPDHLVASTKELVLGLDREWVQPAGFGFDAPILMAAEGPVFINNYYKILDFHINRLKEHYRVVVLDNDEKIPQQFFEGANRFSSSSEVGNVLRTIIDDLKDRIAKPQERYPNWLIIIPNIATTGMSAGLNEADMKLLLAEGAKHGVTALFVGSYQDLVNNSYDSYVKLMLQLVEQVFLGVRISDQNHTRYPYLNNEPALRPNQGYILHPEGYDFIQLLEL